MAGENIDLAIVGSGPNGLYACFKFRELFPNWNIVIFERENFLCANIRSYPNVKWHSKMVKLKLPSALNSYINDDINPMSQEIANYYQEFANEQQLPIRLNHELISLNESVAAKGQGEPSTSMILNFVADGEKTQIHCRYAILATGIYSGVRKLSIQNEKIQYGYSLLTKKKNLILIGSGHSAIDFIINLLPHNQITWILRGEHWTSIFETISGEFHSVYTNYKKNLTVIKNATVSEFNEGNSMILSNGMVLNDFDACNVLIGYSPRNSLNDGIALDFDNECLVLSSEFETSQSNVFAFGSLMATWKEEQGVAAPTFVDNGNDEKLQVIIDSISRREVERIFGPIKVFTQHRPSSTKSKLKILKTFCGYFVKNQITVIYTKTVLNTVVKLNSKVKYLLEKLFTR
jgi:thioredoxin reductase